MRTVSRLRLLFLLLRPGYPNPNGFHIPELSTCLLVALSKPWQAHYEVYSRFQCLCWLCANRIYFMVDLAGVEPASRTLFSLLHTAITYIVYYLLVFVTYLALIASKNTRSSSVNSTKSICSRPPRAKFSS